MKINIHFIRSLPEVTPGSICMLLGQSPEPDTLLAASSEKGSVVIAGPMPWEDHLTMVCAVEGSLHFQPMCFLSEEQKALYTPGEDVTAIPTPWGKLALCCEEDIFQPMYARTAALKGCTLLAARVTRFDESLLISGPWSACQSNCLPVVLGHGDKGQLILPCAMTEDHSGFGENTIDSDALHAAYREFPVFKSLNKAFYRRYREVLLK